MKQILLLLFLIFSFSLSAQVTLKLTEPEGSTTVLASDDDIKAKGSLKNEAEDTVTVMWKRNIIELKDGWETAICEKNICFVPSYGETSTADGTHLVLAPGEESNFDVHAYPNGIEGFAIVEVIITDITNPENTVTGRYEFNQTSTSTLNLNRADIKIYPNPTIDFISISEADQVERLIIYNIVGRPVKLFTANYSNQYDVMDLPTGMYLVRLMDKNDRTIKTVRLSKKRGA